MKKLLLLIIAFVITISCSTDEKPIFNISIEASEGGTVSSSGGKYEQGVVLSVNATPDLGYFFANWSTGTPENPLTLTVNSNQKIIANFEKEIDPIELSIINYLAENNISAERTESGLYYVISSQGVGEYPSSSSSIRAIYKGYFLDGTVFDQSSANGISFSLNQVIKGFQEGFQLFKQGGLGKLIIPPSLGYGDNDYGTIPANSVLVFDIELLEIN